MTEKEKMIRGEWHDANFDPELLEERSKAESLCYDFNMARPGSEAQLSALKGLLETELPEGLTVLAPAYFDYGSRTKFGTGCFVNHGWRIHHNWEQCLHWPILRILHRQPSAEHQGA